jgi:hypothetical protein
MASKVLKLHKHKIIVYGVYKRMTLYGWRLGNYLTKLKNLHSSKFYSTTSTGH